MFPPIIVQTANKNRVSIRAGRTSSLCWKYTYLQFSFQSNKLNVNKLNINELSCGQLNTI